MTVGKALILNVEDNEAKRYLKTRALEKAGFDVVEARTLAAARLLVRQRQPDLVLLDVKLPDGNSRELCAWIKESPETAQTAVLQTSSVLIDSAERVASLDAGADLHNLAIASDSCDRWCSDGIGRALGRSGRAVVRRAGAHGGDPR